jgi:hypothetical protein
LLVFKLQVKFVLLPYVVLGDVTGEFQRRFPDRLNLRELFSGIELGIQREEKVFDTIVRQLLLKAIVGGVWLVSAHLWIRFSRHYEYKGSAKLTI